MSRQHSTPILLPLGGQATSLASIGYRSGEDAVSEQQIQALVHEHPSCLPIQEIDPTFVGPVPICMELQTPAGPIDNFMVTPSGLPVLVECKLWRNPEGRREVVGQILDYAKELSRWSSSDLEREVRRRLKREGNVLLDRVREAHPGVDEIEFNDALTANLRRGRFLLLIVGDGIREGVEAIAEYLQAHAGLHFSLGLVEMPIYDLPDGGRLVVPRVLARTFVVTRTVVAVPDGHSLEDAVDPTVIRELDPDRAALSDAQQKFWAEFLEKLTLDDSEQGVPKPPKLGYLSLHLPAPGGNCWLTVYRSMKQGEVGVFVSSTRGTAGEYAMLQLADAWDDIREDLGGTAKRIERDGRPTIIDAKTFGSLDDAIVRDRAFYWLAERVNTFVNVTRPRVRSAVADYQG
ncbi:hypothetical protein [Brevundimonas sp.]|uniref:hypothetical protein n=1 Tax=Brevundimonas sp. TaxID=1871086 RepID=UPI002604DA93|nr:hypothetical protein [Brevundimonas sp.]